MFKDIKDLFSVLNNKQKNFFLKVQLLASIQAIMEVSSVLILIPFMSIVGDINLIKSNFYFAKVYEFLKFQNEYQFIIFFSIIIVIFFSLSSWVSVFSLKKITYFLISKFVQ